MDSKEYCYVPISGRITITAKGKMTSEYEYGTVLVKTLADLLVQGFGIDVENLLDRNTNPAT